MGDGTRGALATLAGVVGGLPGFGLALAGAPSAPIAAAGLGALALGSVPVAVALGRAAAAADDAALDLESDYNDLLAGLYGSGAMCTHCHRLVEVDGCVCPPLTPERDEIGVCDG